MQRSSLESARARVSSAASGSISSGCTAKAPGDAANVTATTRSASHRIAAYSAGAGTGLAVPWLALAGFGAPTRKRRSESDSAPPITMTAAPSQMSITSGL